MKGADRLILVALPLLAVAIGFWLLVLGPKRGEAKELQDQIDSLQATITASESEIAVSEQAREAFPRNYGDLVSLGAAVPEDNDQATFVHDLSELARQDSVSFRSFELTPVAGAAPALPPSPTTTEPSTTEPTAEATTTSVTTAPTEASAAALPLGAAVGPAGLPVTPYSLTYYGRFFDMADLFAALDDRVELNAKRGLPDVRGRLITIDSFAMSADPVRGFPSVQTDLSVTTYLVPPEQGISAGATPAGPAAVGSAADPTTVAAPPTTAPAGTTAAVTP